MRNKKAAPGNGAAAPLGNGKARRHHKYTTVGASPSIPQKRISLKKLSTIYRLDRNAAGMPEVLTFEQSDLDGVPDSLGMTFEAWLGLCKQKMDVYEEEGDER